MGLNSISTAGILAVISLNAAAQDSSRQQAAIYKAVSYCLTVVHSFHAAEDYMQQYYTNFDAYYNPATGTVQNNANSNGDLKAVFVFNKCMAEQGFPLK